MAASSGPKREESVQQLRLSLRTTVGFTACLALRATACLALRDESSGGAHDGLLQVGAEDGEELGQGRPQVCRS